MNKYEAIFIFRPEDENVSRGTAMVLQEFQNSGITILDQIDPGVRTLSYRIKKSEKGRYHIYNIEAEPDKIKPLEKILMLKDEILKFVFFKKKEKKEKKAIPA
jgi:small subunit ribosomal protein S6